MVRRAWSQPQAGNRSLVGLLFLLAALLVGNTLAGPLGAGLVEYAVSGTLRHQLVGLELVTVLVVAPMAVCAGVLLRSGHPAGAYLAFGAGSYTAYVFVQYVLGPNYGYYRPAAFVHLGLFSLGCAVAIWSWAVAARQPVITVSRRRYRWYGALMLGLAAFTLARYLPALVGAASSTRLPAEFAKSPGFYWSILLLDLGIIVPATVVSAVALLRGASFALTAVYAIMVWYAVVPVSVAAMSVVMLATDDPNASSGQTGLLCTMALSFAGLAVWVLQPVLRIRRPGSAMPDVHRRSFLAGYAALLAVGAYGGALGLVFGYLDLLDRLDQRLPFASPVFGGVALAVLVAVPASVVAVLAWHGDPHTDLAAALDGFLLIGWILVELAFLRELSYLHVIYLLVGVSLVIWAHEALGEIVDAARHALHQGHGRT